MIEPDQSVRKITFSLNQIRLAEYKARMMGISFQEYIRHLVSKDVENLLNKFDILSLEEIEKLEEAFSERKNPKYIVTKNRNELELLLNKWDKERSK